MSPESRRLDFTKRHFRVSKWFATTVASISLAGCAMTPDAPEAVRQCNVKYRTAPPSADLDPKAITPIRLDSGIRNFPSGTYACLGVGIDKEGKVSDLTVLETNHERFADYFARIVVRAKFEPGQSKGVATAGRLIISSAVH